MFYVMLGKLAGNVPRLAAVATFLMFSCKDNKFSTLDFPASKI